MPTKIYGIRTMMAVPTTAQNLYILGYTEKANALIKKSADYIRKEVTYLADVSKSKGTLVGGQNVQIGLVYGLEPMGKIAAKFGQAKLAKDIDKQYNELYNRFSQFFGPQQQ
jgi:hypothetical protein